MKQLCLSICFLSVFVSGIGLSVASDSDEGMTMDRFIQTAREDSGLKNRKALTKYLERAPESTPYIDQMEFRTKTESFDPGKQKYSFRIYPKGWNETKYSKRAAELSRKACKTDEDVFYNTALAERYNLVLDYLETRARIGLTKDWAAVCEDKIHVLKQKNSGGLSFDINDLITTEERLTELRLDGVKYENKLTGLTQKIALAASDNAPIVFEEDKLMPIPAIDTLLQDMGLAIPLNNVKLQDQKNKMVLADTKYKLEQAKNSDYFKFVQVSYDTEAYPDSAKACSLEFAFKLPFIHSDRDKVNQRKVNYLKEKLQYEEEKKALVEKKNSLTRSLDRLIRQYSILTSADKISNAESSFKTYLKTDGVDPLVLLNIKAVMIKNKTQEVKTAFNIRSRFIALLEITGRLTQVPFKNYICKSSLEMND